MLRLHNLALLGDTPPPTATQPHTQEAERLQKRCFWKPGPSLNHLMLFLGTPSLNRTPAVLPLGLSGARCLRLSLLSASRSSERKITIVKTTLILILKKNGF